MALPGRRILLLYGTETGTSLEKAEQIDAVCQRQRFHTDLAALDAVPLNDLLRGHTLVVFVVATTGQGAFPANARRFWKSLRRAKLPPGCLAPVRFVLFGLGDSSYSKFNWAARLLHSRLLRLGATEAFPRGEGDERHDDGADSIFQPWLTDLAAFLREHYPLPPGVAPIPNDEPLPLRYTLAVAGGGEAAVAAPASSSPEDDVVLPIPGGVDATVRSNTRITPDDHFQDVRLVRLDVCFRANADDDDGSVFAPLPGDTVALYPTNDPVDVAWLVDRMGWHAVADRPVRLGAARPDGLFAQDHGTLRQLLTRNMDITAVPTRNVLARLVPFTAHPDQREKLQELVQPDAAQDFYDFTSRPRRTILEVLAEFWSCRIPCEAVPTVFPVIRSREYSIAGATGDGKHTTTLDLLVALVRYQTIIRKPRQGLCSRFVRDRLPSGTRLRVLARRNDRPPPCDAPAAAARPLVAVATGTGVAPVRSLLRDRVQQAGDGDLADALLFFGCRNAAADYYFADEWARTPRLTVVPAFSRDNKSAEATSTTTLPPGAGQNYVQDAIRRHAAAVCALLRPRPGRPPAVIVVCGSSGRMPVAVRAALADAVQLGGLCATAAEAEQLLFDEANSDRIVYWEETW